MTFMIEKTIREIESIRKERGIPVYRLAKDAGMSRSALTRLLNGETKDIKLSTIERIGKAMGCGVTVILHPEN